MEAGEPAGPDFIAPLPGRGKAQAPHSQKHAYYDMDPAR